MCCADENDLEVIMFCKHCGTKLADDAAFCESCGKPTNEIVPIAPILDNNTANAAPAQSAAPMTGSAPTYAPPAPNTLPPTAPVRNSAPAGGFSISVPMVLNIIVACFVVLYAILLCCNWYSVDIDVGWYSQNEYIGKSGVGDDYDVGLFSALDCSEDIAEIIEDYNDYLRDDVTMILLIMSIAPFALFFVGLIELIVVILCGVVNIVLTLKDGSHYHSVPFVWLSTIPIAVIALVIVTNNSMSDVIKGHLCDFSISPTIFIMLAMSIIAELVLDIIGKKYKRIK